MTNCPYCKLAVEELAIHYGQCRAVAAALSPNIGLELFAHPVNSQKLEPGARLRAKRKSARKYARRKRRCKARPLGKIKVAR